MVEFQIPTVPVFNEDAVKIVVVHFHIRSDRFAKLSTLRGISGPAPFKWGLFPGKTSPCSSRSSYLFEVFFIVLEIGLFYDANVADFTVTIQYRTRQT